MYREPLAVPSCSKQKDRFILSAKRSRVLSRSSCRYFFLCASSYFLSLASLFFEKQFLEHPAPGRDLKQCPVVLNVLLNDKTLTKASEKLSWPSRPPLR